MFRGLTEKTHHIINVDAFEIAQTMGDSLVQPEHILIAIMRDRGSEAVSILEQKIDLNNFLLVLERYTVSRRKPEPCDISSLQKEFNLKIRVPVSSRTEEVLKFAINESLRIQSNVLSSYSIFVACCAEKSTIAESYIKQQGYTAKDLSLFVRGEDISSYKQGFQAENELDFFPIVNSHKLLHKHMYKRDDQFPKRAGDKSGDGIKVEQYFNNLTEHAKKKGYDSIFGRQKEIEAVYRILLRQSKNNPILVGDPGVGKTALVEELARQIAFGECPIQLLSAQVLQLDIAGLTAGTRYRGDFEERFIAVLNEIKKRSKKNRCIIFVDEIHHIIGAGLAVGLTMDAAGMLKPALARGEICLIGATTDSEYHKYIEKDSAFSRRLQKVEIEEMSIEDTYEALVKAKHHYEQNHRVVYEPEIIKEIVTCADVYLQERKFPDKAFDLLDEVGSYYSLLESKTPSELHLLYKQEIELSKLVAKTEKDDVLIPHREKHALSSPYGNKEASTDKQNSLSNDFSTSMLSTGYSATQFENPRQHKSSLIKIKNISSQRKNLESQLSLDATKYVKSVSLNKVREIISLIVGVPVEKMLSDKKKIIRQLNDSLKEKVVGQNEAIDSLLNSLRRSYVGLRENKRPMGVFLFLGPTGVGKTFTAKQLSLDMFGSETCITRFDMSEFMDMQSHARFVGAAPGYAGFEDGSPLIRAVKKRPHQVLLFDEIEKAHPKVLDVFLQLFDEGQLTSLSGETGYFQHSIIIMTSNLGSEQFEFTPVGFSGSGASEYESTKNAVLSIAKQSLRPEFLNRFDDIVLFNPLKKPELSKICYMLTQGMRDFLASENIHIDFHPSSFDALLQQDTQYKSGARQIKWNLSKIENLLSDALIEERIVSGDTIEIRYDDGDFFVQNISQSKPYEESLTAQEHA